MRALLLVFLNSLLPVVLLDAGMGMRSGCEGAVRTLE